MSGKCRYYLQRFSFNRTIEELKYKTLLSNYQAVTAFNRTIEELKCTFPITPLSDMNSFNRTIEELKLKSYQCPYNRVRF